MAHKKVRIHSISYFLYSLRYTYALRRWAIKGDIKMVSQEICDSLVVMAEKYTKFNLRKLKNNCPSIADRIEARLAPHPLMTHISLTF